MGSKLTRKRLMPSTMLGGLAALFLLFGQLPLTPRDHIAKGAPAAISTPSPTPTEISGAHVSIETATGEIVSDLNANGLIDPGDTISFLISFRNSGTERLTNLILVDDYDQDLIHSISNVSQDGLDDGDKITWKTESLDRGESGSFSYDASLKDVLAFVDAAIIQNTVIIYSDQAVPVTSTTAVEVRVPKLRLSKGRALIKDLNGDARPGPGDTIEYMITVENIGDFQVTNILLEDNYDESLFQPPTKISDDGEDNGDLIRWHIDVLDSTQNVSFTYEAKVIVDFPPGVTIVANTATVSSDVTSPSTARNSFEVELSPTVTPTEQPATPTPEPQAGSAGTSPKIEIKGEHLIQLAALYMIYVFLALILLTVMTALGKEVPTVFRDGFLLSLVLGPIVILALGGSIDRSAVAGLVGTVAGYVLRSGLEGIREIDTARGRGRR